VAGLGKRGVDSSVVMAIRIPMMEGPCSRVAMAMQIFQAGFEEKNPTHTST
jgi:hypothetical protein